MKGGQESQNGLPISTPDQGDKNRSLAKPSGEALLGVQGAHPVLAFPPTPLLPSLCQMQAKEPQDKIHQPISKVIERNRLKMVRRRIWVPLKTA